MADKYFYRPLAAYAGKVFKCAGICDESNVAMANELFIGKVDPVYLSGFVILDIYRGDKVTIDSNNAVKEFKFGDVLPAEESLPRPVKDQAPAKPVVLVEVRNVFGNATIYPANAAAERFAAIAGKKTLSNVDLMNIQALGFVIEEATPKKLAA